LWATGWVAAGAVTSASLVEDERACAAETQAQAATAQTAMNPALRISVETLNAKPSPQEHEKPNRTLALSSSSIGAYSASSR